jgi:hypothetical protein
MKTLGHADAATAMRYHIRVWNNFVKQWRKGIVSMRRCSLAKRKPEDEFTSH